jgi:hypothetical protein
MATRALKVKSFALAPDLRENDAPWVNPIISPLPFMFSHLQAVDPLLGQQVSSEHLVVSVGANTWSLTKPIDCPADQLADFLE